MDGGGDTGAEEVDPDAEVMFDAPGDLLPSSRLDCNKKNKKTTYYYKILNKVKFAYV